MEAAALVQAHSHARNASQETFKGRLIVAASEHDYAAGDFAKAVGETTEIEALRILRLLQEHHEKLGQIIKAKYAVAKRVSKPVATSTNDTEKPPATEDAIPPLPSIPLVESPERSHGGHAIRKMAERRDSSPALAKDMASRRGIPQASQRRVQSVAPNVSTVQAAGKMAMGNPRHATTQAHDRSEQEQKELNWSQTEANNATIKAVEHDDGFSRFYSNLASGPLSKLSSMLAFAGLPLTEGSQDDAPVSSKSLEKTSVQAISGPDVKQIFSKAALRAIEEQQRNQGFSGSTFGPGESFYVIPASGGTASYANILSRAQQEAQRQQVGDDPGDFGDAREDSARQSSLSGRAPIATGSVREEELQIENAALKQILDKLSHRLQAFESHAQDASMAVLTQSMASVRTQGTTHNHDVDDRMRAMEAQLEKEMKERERLGLENQKQKQLIAKYRSHWEDLKNSARAKDKAKREKADSGG